MQKKANRISLTSCASGGKSEISSSLTSSSAKNRKMTRKLNKKLIKMDENAGGFSNNGSYFKLNVLLNPTTLNRFLTNFHSFDKVIKNLRLKSENKSLGTSSYFNYVLVKTLVKYEKKLLKLSNRSISNEAAINYSNKISQIATKTVQSPPSKLPILEENNTSSNLDCGRDQSSSSNNSYTIEKDKAKKRKSGFFGAFRRREFIMRILDFNFFLFF